MRRVEKKLASATKIHIIYIEKKIETTTSKIKYIKKIHKLACLNIIENTKVFRMKYFNN